jgi:hypothetical protein
MYSFTPDTPTAELHAFCQTVTRSVSKFGESDPAKVYPDLAPSNNGGQASNQSLKCVCLTPESCTPHKFRDLAIEQVLRPLYTDSQDHPHSVLNYRGLRPGARHADFKTAIQDAPMTRRDCHRGIPMRLVAVVVQPQTGLCAYVTLAVHEFNQILDVAACIPKTHTQEGGRSA